MKYYQIICGDATLYRKNRNHWTTKELLNEELFTEKEFMRMLSNEGKIVGTIRKVECPKAHVYFSFGCRRHISGKLLNTYVD